MPRGTGRPTPRGKHKGRIPPGHELLPSHWPAGIAMQKWAPQGSQADQWTLPPQRVLVRGTAVTARVTATGDAKVYVQASPTPSQLHLPSLVTGTA